MTDVELLALHRKGDESAFADLVRRHLGWVCGLARRRLGDSHRAEDVGQAVFVLLHRKAPAFASDGAMIGWLHKAARYTAEAAAREDRRRRTRESLAAQMQSRATDASPNGTSDESEVVWAQLAPILDDLVGRLSRSEREAILLRYYRDLSFAEVGIQLRTTPDAARKRVERAVEKLRTLAAKKGPYINTAVFPILLAGHVRAIPPPGWVASATIAATANSGSLLTASTGSIVKGAIILMTIKQIVIASIVAAICICIGGGTVATTKWLISRSSTTPVLSETDAPSPVIPDSAIPLPARLPPPRIALRVLSPQGQPMHIDDLVSIEGVMDNGMRWHAGSKGMIRTRYSQGWVLVDQENIADPPDHRVEVTFKTGGVAILAAGTFPSDNKRQMTFTALANPNEVGIDKSSGPVLTSADAVAGRVVDPKGRPMAGAIVSYPRPKALDLLVTTPPATTGEDGVFWFPNNGRYEPYLQIEKPGFAPRWLLLAPTDKSFTVHLDDQTHLRGQLTLPDGSPAKNALMELKAIKPTGYRMISTEEIPWSATTDAQGLYDIPLEPGEYNIRISSPDGFAAWHPLFVVASGQSASLPPCLLPGVKLAIQAVDSLTGLPVADVHFAEYDNVPGYAWDDPDTETITDDKGMAISDHMIPGPNEFSVRSDRYARWWVMDDLSPRQRLGRGIDLLRLNLFDGMKTVKVAVEPGVRITGKILSPFGRPVHGARVNIDGLETGDQRYSRLTDEHGQYSLLFPDLQRVPIDPRQKQPGYAIVVTDPVHLWGDATSERFKPKPGDTKTINLHMGLFTSRW